MEKQIEENIASKLAKLTAGEWLVFVEQILFNKETAPKILFTETVSERLNYVYNILSENGDEKSKDMFLNALINAVYILPFYKHHRPADLFFEVFCFIDGVKPIKQKPLLLKLLSSEERRIGLQSLFFNKTSMLKYLEYIVQKL